MLRVLLGLILAVGIGWGSWQLYRFGRQRLWERRVQRMLQEKDYQNAAFWASRLIREVPRGALGWRALAEAADATGSPEALLLRARVAQLAPTDPESFLAWAKTALRLGQLEQAGEALNAISPAARNTVGYHSLAAAWAIARGLPALGETHFAEAARLDPTNPLHALNLAALRLQRPSDPAAGNQARGEIEKLAAAHVNLRLPARRALLAEATRREDHPRAVVLAREMLADSSAEFNDRLSALAALWGAQDPAYATVLSERQEEAVARPENVPTLLYWLANHSQADVGLGWARALADRGVAAARTIPAQVAVADLLLARKDWPALRDYLAPLDWKRLDYIRGAMLARIVRETDPPRFPPAWQAFSGRLAKQSDLQMLVVQLVRHWGWSAEAEELLWQVAGRPSLHQRTALGELFALYQARGQTAPLLRVVRKQQEFDRDDLAAQNNGIYLSLLLGEETSRAHELAASFRAKHPNNPAAVSTYGLSAFLRRDFATGLRALESLPPEALRDPTIALGEGLLLAGNGQREKAQPYFDIAAAGQLLPEERALLEQAKRER